MSITAGQGNTTFQQTVHESLLNALDRLIYDNTRFHFAKVVFILDKDCFKTSFKRTAEHGQPWQGWQGLIFITDPLKISLL